MTNTRPATTGETATPEARTSGAVAHRGRVGACVLAIGAIGAVVTGVTVSANASTAHHHAHRTTAAAHSRATRAASPRVASDSVTYVQSTDGGGSVWIPADRSGQWELSRPDLPEASKTETANCAAFRFFQTATTKVRDADGHWKVISRGGLPNCSHGDWSIYRPAFAASLPADPSALLSAMRNSGLGTRDVDAFVTGSNFIGTGWVEPRVVGNIVAALKLIPGVQITQDVDNGAGATGEALTYSGRAKATVLEHWTVIVDPASNQVIGTKLSYAGGGDSNTLTYRQVAALGDRG